MENNEMTVFCDDESCIHNKINPNDSENNLCGTYFITIRLEKGIPVCKERKLRKS